MCSNDFFIIDENKQKYMYNVNIINNIYINENLINVKFICNNIIYIFKKYINKRYCYVENNYNDCYQFVALFESINEKNNKIIVKFEIPRGIDENDYSLKMFNKNDNNIIKHRIINLNNNENSISFHNIYIMEYMDGNFIELLALMDTYNITKLDIIKYLDIIREQIIYLYNHDLYYVDLKMSNLLFKLTEDNNIVVSIGDFGSTSIDEEGDSALTFPPIEYHMNKGYIKINKNNFNSIVSWGIGCLLLYIFNNKQPIYLVYDNILNITHHEYDELLSKNIDKLNKNEKKIILMYLDKNLENRPDINISIEEIYNKIILKSNE